MRDLPPRMHRKNGSFYYVRDNRWLFLAGDLPRSMDMYRALEHGLDKNSPPAWISMETYLAQTFWRAKKNARARGIDFCLTRDEFEQIVARADGLCEFTGIPFELRVRPGSARRPFAPSLDRIDCGKGYSLENCRLICGAVNAALSDWGEGVLRKIAAAVRLSPRRL